VLLCANDCLLLLPPSATAAVAAATAQQGDSDLKELIQNPVYPHLLVFCHDGLLIGQQGICNPVEHGYPLLRGEGLQLTGRIAGFLSKLTS
jgi:hypothetical protein